MEVKKFTEQGPFSFAVQRAVTDYDRSRGTVKWTQAELDEIARSSAISQELSYDGNEVDPAIVKAIRAMADINLSMDAASQALDDAWKAYRKRALN